MSNVRVCAEPRVPRIRAVALSWSPSRVKFTTVEEGAPINSPSSMLNALAMPSIVPVTLWISSGRPSATVNCKTRSRVRGMSGVLIRNVSSAMISMEPLVEKRWPGIGMMKEFWVSSFLTRAVSPSKSKPSAWFQMIIVWLPGSNRAGKQKGVAEKSLF